MNSPRWGIPAASWLPTILASAVFGGIFWAVLTVATGVFDGATTGAHRPLPAVLTAVVVAGLGWLIHLLPSPRTKTLGMAMALGASLGLPVLGYVALVAGS